MFVNDIALEIQNKIAIFLGLRPKLNEATKHIGKFPVLIERNSVLYARVEKNETKLFDTLPKISPLSKGQIPPLATIPQLLKDLGNVNANMNKDIADVYAHLTLITKATGVKFDMPKPATMNFVPLVIAIGGFSLVMIANLIRKGK